MDVLYIFIIVSVFQDYAAARCGFPGSPNHCHVSFSNETLSEGTVATYVCESGFELLGPSRRVCDGGEWTPEGIPFCVVNVAAGKAPMQSSTEGSGVPQRALDGSTSAVYLPDTCTLTKRETKSWWYVNLLEPYMVQLVRIDFGKPCCDGGPASIVIRVGNNRPDLGTNPICRQYIAHIEEGHQLYLSCDPPMPGAFVSVHIDTSGYGQLSICEAFVYTDQALPIERCPQFRDQPPGSTATYNGKCYIFYNREPATFREALGFCRSRGGSLVYESNPALQGFISWELWRRHRSNSNSQYWMGAVRDPQDPNNWKWINGNDVTVSFWNAPGNGAGCANFDGANGWLWAESDCQSKINFICQHQPKTCGHPEQPPNSTMTPGPFEVGTSVEYVCDEGHLLVGAPVRTCLETGFFDEYSPFCNRVECGFPASIKHGSYNLINGSVTFLSQVKYECDAGYERAGYATLVCDIDGRWNGPPPLCEAVQCGDPPQVGSGRVNFRNKTFGSVAEYSCFRGFQLHGANKIACQASGLWDKPAPVCLPIEIKTTTASTSTTVTTPSTSTLPSTTPRIVLPSRRPDVRVSSPTPFHTETTRRPRPKASDRPRTTTDLPSTKRPQPQATIADNQDAPTSHVPHIIVATHPRENQIIGSGNNIIAEQTSGVNVPTAVEGGGRAPDADGGSRLGIGTVVALAGVGALIFLIAIITTIMMLARSIKRNNDNGGYHHPDVRDCATVASVESSSTDNRNGLGRYYRQAWQQLHEASDGYNQRACGRGQDSTRGPPTAIPMVHQARRHHHHHRRVSFDDTANNHSPRAPKPHHAERI